MKPSNLDVSAKPKQEFSDRVYKFVDEYLVDMNATQAAIRAGYSAKTGSEQALA